MGFKPFTPQGEALVLSSLPTVVRSARDEVYGEIVTQPLLPASMWDFSRSPLPAPCLGAAWTVLRFFSEAVVPCLAAHLVCLWEEASLGSPT